ncbi:MAG: MBL fold metallo-hydrolase [Rhodospirillales bacterium]
MTPVINDWYAAETLNDGVTLITERHVAAWVRCNIWHVRGRDRDLLIDTGMGVKPLKTEIAALCERPVTVIGTHSHFDHMGGAHEFSERLGHRAEAEIYARPTHENTACTGFIRAETFTAAPHAGFTHESYVVRPAPLTGYIDEGDVIDLGDRVFRVLHLPGHSPGSVALFEEKTKTLFSGDTVYDGALYDTVYHSDPALYRESLMRLKDLPAAVVHGGHYASFGRPRLCELINGYLAGENRIDDPADWVDARLADGA